MSIEFEKWLMQMKANQKKSIEACEKTINSAVGEMFAKVIERTPEGNPSLWHFPAPPDYNPGTLRASWEINKSNSGRDINSGRFIKKETSSTNDNVSQQWTGIKLNVNVPQTITIANRQPYAWRVEFGSWSSQAPQGMLRITIKEYSSILDKHARQNKL